MSEKGVHAIEVTIDGDRYETNTLGGEKGTEIIGQVLAMIGDAVAAGGSAATAPQLGFGARGAAVFTKALGALMRSAGEPKVFLPLAKSLLGELRKNDKRVNFNLEFAANYGVLSQLVVWSFKENFESFFVGNPALDELLGVLMEKAGDLDLSTSTGESGASSAEAKQP